MALKDPKLPTAIVKLTTDQFSVRGLSLDDILSTMRTHADQLITIFEDVKEKRTELTDDLIGEYATNLVQSAPGLAARLIMLATDEAPDDEEAFKVASRLPASVQFDALVKIGQLTFSLEGGLKKVVETVVSLARGTTSLMSEMRALPTGSGGSGGKQAS